MKRILFALIFSGSMFTGFAQTERAWKSVSSPTSKLSKNALRQSFPKEFKLFQLEGSDLRQVLQSAPERSFSRQGKGVVISIPNADGSLERFEVFEASNFDAALQAQFPQIRAYAGKGLDDKSAVLRLSSAPSGFSGMILRSGKKSEFIENYSEDGKTYAVFHSSRDNGGLPWECSTDEAAIISKAARQADETQAPASNSGELLTFRLAMSTNGEYTQYHGGTVASALVAINNTITRVNGVFERDLAIHLTIIPQSTQVIFTNAATDPYSTNLNQWNNQLQNTLTNVIGEANYDVGHMFGASGGGGNAGCIGCVCENGKGSGITSPADNVPMGDTFDIDYVAHELGHQFGANHTFSHGVEGSGVNVEPGSGSTIMAYAGITNYNVQMNSDDYFVYASIKQIQDNMVDKTCPVRTPITNPAPVVNAGRDYTIPRGTPFVLTGSATDEGGDTLSYCWEQNDSATTQQGASSVASPNKTGGPIFRSYDPVLSPSRYFPRLATVLNNMTVTNSVGTVPSIIAVEAIPNVTRQLNFVLTARDVLGAGVGQTGSDAVVVNVNAAAGPFLVTSPNTAVNFAAASNQTITWNVAGTTANNVNAAYVDIFLSTDGGQTYPLQLASKVPNDGSEVVTIPNVPGTTNRIMVKGYDHIFYDLSNVNFTITEAVSTFSVAYSPAGGGQNIDACASQGVTFTIPYTAFNGFAGAATFSVTGQPAGTTATFSPETISASGDVTLTLSDMESTPNGLYSLLVSVTADGTTKTVPLYVRIYGNDFVPVSLTAPADNTAALATSVGLTWESQSNATSYKVEVALDEAFAFPIAITTVTGTSYQLTNLTEGTTYFWRVQPINDCATGAYSTVNSFRTGQVACGTVYTSTNVPLTINQNVPNVINSTITVPAGVIASSITVTAVGTHTYVGDLSFELISPSGTQIPLVAEACGSGDNFNVTFSDAGSALACTIAAPSLNGTIVPASPLSAISGQSAAGNWTLRISDGYNGDGGTLTAWSISMCSPQLATPETSIQDFAIYPNPNNGNFNIQFTPNGSNDVEVNVHDIRGREIFNRKYQSNGLFNENLQLDGASSGIYLVTVQSGNAKVTRKIVIE